MNRVNSLTETLRLQVCVHRGTIYPVGQFWEEGCDTCTCTDLEDAVMGLRVAQCSQKPCADSCRPVRGSNVGAVGTGIPGMGKTVPLGTSGSRPEGRGPEGSGAGERKEA